MSKRMRRGAQPPAVKKQRTAPSLCEQPGQSPLELLSPDPHKIIHDNLGPISRRVLRACSRTLCMSRCQGHVHRAWDKDQIITELVQFGSPLLVTWVYDWHQTVPLYELLEKALKQDNRSIVRMFGIEPSLVSVYYPHERYYINFQEEGDISSASVPQTGVWCGTCGVSFPHQAATSKHTQDRLLNGGMCPSPTSISSPRTHYENYGSNRSNVIVEQLAYLNDAKLIEQFKAVFSHGTYNDSVLKGLCRGDHVDRLVELGHLPVYTANTKWNQRLRNVKEPRDLARVMDTTLTQLILFCARSTLNYLEPYVLTCDWSTAWGTILSHHIVSVEMLEILDDWRTRSPTLKGSIGPYIPTNDGIIRAILRQINQQYSVTYPNVILSLARMWTRYPDLVIQQADELFSSSVYTLARAISESKLDSDVANVLAMCFLSILNEHQYRKLMVCILTENANDEVFIRSMVNTSVAAWLNTCLSNLYDSQAIATRWTPRVTNKGIDLLVQIPHHGGTLKPSFCHKSMSAATYLEQVEAGHIHTKSQWEYYMGLLACAITSQRMDSSILNQLDHLATLVGPISQNEIQWLVSRLTNFLCDGYEQCKWSIPWLWGLRVLFHIEHVLGQPSLMTALTHLLTMRR